MPKASSSIERLAIVMDMMVTDEAGRPTTPETDRRANYDVGLLIDDTAACTIRDVSIFGHGKKAGVCLVSRGIGVNPDYNTFWNCSLMRDYGVAILGSDQADGPGLSGTQFFGCRIFASDHHHRPSQQWGKAAVLIDRNTKAKHADVNGHYFFGCCIRTYADMAVELVHASNVAFHSVTFELPKYSDSDRS